MSTIESVKAAKAAAIEAVDAFIEESTDSDGNFDLDDFMSRCNDLIATLQDALEAGAE